MVQQKVVLRILAMNDDKTKQKAIEAAADVYEEETLEANNAEKRKFNASLAGSSQPPLQMATDFNLLRWLTSNGRARGVDSIAADTKEQKLTVIGEMDAIAIAKKLKKLGKVEILTGPALGQVWLGDRPGPKFREGPKIFVIDGDVQVSNPMRHAACQHAVCPMPNAACSMQQI